MSLLPMLFSKWWEDLDRPHRIFDQHFGLTLNPEDLLESIAPSSDQIMIYRPNRRALRYHPYISSRRDRGSSVVQADKNKFKVTLDVQQFSPDEIDVKVVDNNVVVEANHEEKQDEHGWISRKFLRKYIIPSQCDIEKVESHLSSDGVLTITAPRKQEQIESNERKITIQFTGQPAIKHVETNGSAEKIEDENQKIQNTPQRGRKTSTKAA